MQTPQDRILSELERVANAHGIECARAAAYSNTGIVHLYRPGSTTAFAGVAYDFQSSGYTLSLTVGSRRVPSQVGRGDYFDFHQGYDQHTRFWSVLTQELKPYAGKPIVPATENAALEALTKALTKVRASIDAEPATRARKPRAPK